MRPSALQFLIPGELQSATGGYVYDRSVIDGLRAFGWQVDVHRLDGSFPQPNAAALAHADSLLSRLPDAALVLVDGLALGAMPELIEAHAGRLVVVALIHMPLAAQFGLDPSLAAQRAQRELRALRSVRHVIVTSQATAQQLTAAGLPYVRLSVVEPGVDPDAPLARRHYDGTLRLLCVGTVSDGKGHELLIEALTPLTNLPWQLCCIGSLSRSPGTVERVRVLLQRCGLESRVQLLDERPHQELRQHYCAADVFVLATQRETYCMAVAEALAHGLPIISTHTGAIAQLVGSDAGILIEPGDVRALQAVLAQVLSQPSLGQRLADAALIARRRLKSWTATCGEFAAALATAAPATTASPTERAG
jgi:glycosyltransferase involved in cell wall biosynthesis